MVAVRKLPSAQTDFEVGGRNFALDLRESKPSESFAGFIFVCSNGTIPDRIFGLPLTHASSVRAIKKGMPLFLFNYSTRCLCGVFEAACDGGFNLDPYAWENIEVRRLGKQPVSRYPAQVRVNLKFQRPPLDEETFRPVLDHVEGHKFRLEVTEYQVKQLLKLFSVPEKEFFGDRSKKWPQGAAIGAHYPDSPRSTFKSDSDCYSECSSKGTYCGEEDWLDEDKAGKTNTQPLLAHGNSEPYLSDKLSNLSLNGRPNINYKVIDENLGDNLLPDTAALPGMPFRLYGTNTTAPHRQQSALKRNSARNPHSPWPVQAFESRDVNQVISRLHEADPAVNSKGVYVNTVSVHQPQGEDEANSPSYVPVNIPPPYLGCEDMIYIPVQTQPRWSEQKKLNGTSLASKHGLSSENHDKVLNSRNQKLSHQHYPIYRQGPQYGQVLLPFYAARPGSIYDSNHMAAVLSPVVSPTYGQGASLAHPQLNSMDQIEEGHATMNFSQMHGGGYPNFLHNGQFPVLVYPSVIPRMPPSPLPIAGFIEALHFNILQFSRLTRPSAETQFVVEAAIDSIQSCVRTVWPDADVEVFGSFATGLCLQHSDVDLAVVNAPLLPSLLNMTTSQASSFLLRELGLSLKTSKCCDSYNVIANASVPVLKCYCRPIVKMSNPSFLVPSIAIDITIGGIENSSYAWKNVLKGPNVGKLGPQQHTGGAAREYVLSKIRELPALAPLVLVMKSFLHHRGLSNVYLGGLGSFSLTLLLAYYLERVPLSEEGITDRVFNDISLSQIAPSTPSCLSDFLEEYEMPFENINGDIYYSNYKSEDVNWSLGEYYVRKAANVIEKILSHWDAGGMAYLGTLLLGFLRTFGFEQDLARKKIVLKGIDGSPGGIFKRDNRHIAVWIDDPLRPGVNIAAGSFGMCQVQAAFREMLLALVNGQPLTTAVHCDEKDCQDLAAFGQLSQLSRLLIEFNDHCEQD